MKPIFLVAVACGLGLATSAAAQRPQSAARLIPVALRPPAGMCRIWLEGVPASRQPAPTDCASALRNRPPRSQVIFGDDFLPADSDGRAGNPRAGGRDLPLRGLAPLPKGLEPRLPDSSHAGRRAGDSAKKSDPHKAVPPVKPDSTARAHPDSSRVRG
ncbi:MAG TPA: hypothetical protein VFK16_04060 [Gemmatimonadaceae bacterium]|nr:hypothetical protein [Gemmatimonadaceae bacterium]